MKLPNKPRLSKSDLDGIVEEAEKLTFFGDLTLSDWRSYPVRLVGMRGYFQSLGKPGANDRGIYDDAIIIQTKDGDNIAWNANVDPTGSRPGIASLAHRQVILYRPGFHGYGKKTGHPAFRQASTVIVKRDGNTGNGKALGSGYFQDNAKSRFWINLHKGAYDNTSSLGCQTIPPSQWDAFHSLLTSLLKRYQVNEFAYLLI